MKKTAPFILLIIIFVVAAWYFFTREPDPVHELPTLHQPPSVPSGTMQSVPPVDDSITDIASKPVRPPVPLPPLGESDPEVTQALAEITGADRLAQFLIKSNIISRFVTVVDSLGSRQVPPQVNPVRPVDGTFAVNNMGERMALSSRNYSRYDSYVVLIQDVDSEAVVEIYQRYYPLFQQAWEENGGEGPFNKRLQDVIDLLLETPDVPGPVYLVKPEGFYLYENPELEAMTAGEKTLVRMGSVNASIIKGKLAEMKAALRP